MYTRIIALCLFFACARAISLSSGHLDFMAGAKRENILHLKDPHTEVQDFCEAFKEVANSEEKVKTTFRILNRPNDSRFKLDLMLIISQMEVMDNESQSYENKKNAWAVLQPLLSKYDKNFAYPADYDVLSGRYVEVLVDDWLDRYTQEKVVARKDAEEAVPEGSGQLEILESDKLELKSFVDGSGSLEEYVKTLEQVSAALGSLDGSGFVDEVSVAEEDLAAFVSEENDSSTEEEESSESTEESVGLYSTEEDESASTEESVLHYTVKEEEDSASTEESVVQYLTEQEEDSASTEESVVQYLTEQDEESASTEESVVHYSTEQDEESAATEERVVQYSTKQDDSSQEFELHTTTTEEDKSRVTEGYELQFTTGEEDDESTSTEGYVSEEEVETTTEYQFVGTTEDGEAVLQSTTEYFLPEVDEQHLVDLLAAEEGEESNEVLNDEGIFEFKHRSGYIVVDKEPIQAGSVRGIPGVHFPDYDEIPITSFTCADKKYVPGFYADLETGCQVFHVCWPHRRESFLCPIGTVFNQAILSCDYWYSTNCSLSPLYYEANDHIHPTTTPVPPPTHKPARKTKTTTAAHIDPPATPAPSLVDVDWARVLSILPIKSKVTVYPQPPKTSTATKHVQFAKSEKSEDLKKAFATQIIGKVLHAAETLAKTAVRSMPVKYATTQKSVKLHPTGKPVKIHTTTHKPVKIHTTTHKPVKVYTTTHKPVLVHPTGKPVKVYSTTQKPVIVHPTGKPVKVYTTEKPTKVHTKFPPKINPRFVVKPSYKKIESLKPILAGKLAAHPKQQKVKLSKEHIPNVLLGAMEMAGTVLQKDILPLTRMALVESSLKHSKAKKH